MAISTIVCFISIGVDSLAQFALTPPASSHHDQGSTRGPVEHGQREESQGGLPKRAYQIDDLSATCQRHDISASVCGLPCVVVHNRYSRRLSRNLRVTCLSHVAIQPSHNIRIQAVDFLHIDHRVNTNSAAEFRITRCQHGVRRFRLLGQAC